MRKKILVVDDEKLIRWNCRQKLTDWGYDVLEAETGAEAMALFEREFPDLVLLDNHLPDALGIDLLPKMRNSRQDAQIVVATGFGSIDAVVQAMRGGAYDFVTKPIDFLKLQTIVKNALEASAMKSEIAYYRDQEKKTFLIDRLVAPSNVMRRTLAMAETVARSETTIVLLQGESGTGKDLLARTIHHLSRRRDGAFVAINCSAIPENLLESELFGYERGAFTDAKQQKKGQAELADGGTLFLDEISTLSLPLQAKLLRFLESMTFKRVGGLEEIHVDIRIIAATNQDLEAEIEAGRFRTDLFFRLNVCPIHIPSLRERGKEAILELSEIFIRDFNKKFKKKITGLSPAAGKLLAAHDWPGNVRELKNAIERAMIFETGHQISERYLPIKSGSGKAPRKGTSGPAIGPGNMSLEAMEKAMLVEALRLAKGNKSEAARILEITRDTLRYKIGKHGIPAGGYPE